MINIIINTTSNCNYIYIENFLLSLRLQIDYINSNVHHNTFNYILLTNCFSIIISDCKLNTFLYDGKCYKSCPNGTYMVPETPYGEGTLADGIPINVMGLNGQMGDSNNNNNNNNNDNNASKSQPLSLRSTTATFPKDNNRDDTYNDDDESVDDEMMVDGDEEEIFEENVGNITNESSKKNEKNNKNDDKEFNDLNDILNIKLKRSEMPQKFCYPCHESCYECRGPFDYDCTACDSNSIHTVIGPDQEYCLPVPTTPNHRTYEYISTDTIFFMSYTLSIVVMILVFYCLYYLMKKYYEKREKEYFYNPIQSKDVDEEFLPHKFQTEKPISSSSRDYCDSSTDDGR